VKGVSQTLIGGIGSVQVSRLEISASDDGPGIGFGQARVEGCRTNVDPARGTLQLNQTVSVAPGITISRLSGMGLRLRYAYENPLSVLPTASGMRRSVGHQTSQSGLGEEWISGRPSSD
jgi:hypothetical protein